MHRLLVYMVVIELVLGYVLFSACTPLCAARLLLVPAGCRHCWEINSVCNRTGFAICHEYSTSPTLQRGAWHLRAGHSIT